MKLNSLALRLKNTLLRMMSSLLLAFLFFRTLWVPCPGASIFHSSLLLFGFTLAAAAAGCLLRPSGGFLVPTLLALGLYSTLAYRTSFPRQVVLCLVLAAVLCCICGASVLWRRTPGSLRDALHRGAAAAGLALLPLLLLPITEDSPAPLFSTMFHLQAHTWEEQRAMGQEATDLPDGEPLALLGEDWAELDGKERLEVITELVAREAAYDGLPFSLTVCASSLEDGSAGDYFPERRTILISRDLLAQSDSRACVEAALTFCQMAYQTQLVELYQSSPFYQELFLLQEVRGFAQDPRYARYMAEEYARERAGDFLPPPVGEAAAR